MKTMLFLLLGTLAAHAQLTFTLSPAKGTGQKASAAPTLTNHFTARPVSSPAAGFSLERRPVAVSHNLNWHSAASTNRHTRLVVGRTNAFSSVFSTLKSSSTTNQTRQAMFRRVPLDAEKLACTGQAAQVQAPVPNDGKETKP